MKAEVTTPSDEPVGIVISGMPSAPPVAFFAAYEWGPAPSNSEDDPKTT